DESFAFGRDENGLGNGDSIEILSPSPALVASRNAAKKSNDLSVLRVRHANRTILLTGDIEEEAWTVLQTTYRGFLKTDYLQASHHGRDSGFHEPSLKLIALDKQLGWSTEEPSTDRRTACRAVG